MCHHQIGASRHAAVQSKGAKAKYRREKDKEVVGKKFKSAAKGNTVSELESGI